MKRCRPVRGLEGDWQALNNGTTYKARWSDNTVAALIQCGIFEGKFAEPSDTAPTDTSLIWVDTSEQTGIADVPATIRAYNSTTSTWELAVFSDIFG